MLEKDLRNYRVPIGDRLGNARLRSRRRLGVDLQFVSP